MGTRHMAKNVWAAENEKYLQIISESTIASLPIG